MKPSHLIFLIVTLLRMTLFFDLGRIAADSNSPQGGRRSAALALEVSSLMFSLR